MRRNTRKPRYTADFETATWLENETYVWCWAVCEIGNDFKTNWGTNIESFIQWCKSCNNPAIYFHNLKFDGEFILSYLLFNGYKCTNGDSEIKNKTFKTLISDMGQFFSITVYFDKNNYCTFYDSLKIIPLKIEKMPKSFGLPIKKLDLDYQKERKRGYIPNEEELAYILNDVKIPAMSLKTLFDQNLNKMTQAGNAMQDFKDIIRYKTFNRFFPELPIEIDSDIRKAYRGGFTFLNDIHANKTLYNGIVLDVNSLYPSVMYEKKLPIDYPIFFEGKYQHDNIYDIYVQRIICRFELKNGKIPTIQIKDDKQNFNGTEYLKSSNGKIVALTLTNIDLKLFLENYKTYDLEYIAGWKFRSCRGVFNGYIDKWSGEKIKAKKEENKGMYTLAKLMLNSLYGKFGLNPITKSKTPYLYDGIVKYKTGAEEKRKPIYVPMALFITSYAREKTIRTSQVIRDYSIQKYGVDKYIYSDTDSIHTTLTENELKQICDVDDYKLGAWKIENTFKRGKFLRQKTYVEEIDGKLKITCAGLPEACYDRVTFENFNEDLTIETGKLRYKHVIGGVKLVDTPFTIKKYGYLGF